jgi:hypothetical protein
MKALNHPQAQRWIHARLAGELKPAVTDRLSAHLQNCEACRLYAAQIQNLDAGLRQEFRARRLSAPAVPAHAFDAIPYQVVKSRAKMNTQRFLVNSLSFSLLLIVLAGGFALLLSNPSLLNVLAPPAPVPEPGPELLPTLTPLPTLAPTPSPAWSAEAPLTSMPEISVFLQGLAEKNQALLRAPGWLHTTRSDMGQEGTIPSYFVETWAHYPLREGTFPETLVLVKDQPEREKLVQLQVCLPDGTCGDLVALRDGKGAVQQLVAAPDPTTAGSLAKRLADEEAALSKNGEVDGAQAWFETLDGKQVLVVSMHFSPLQPSPTTPETTEVYSFDLETGMALRENIRMVYPDGSLFGETLAAYQYEFLSEMPSVVAQQFADASAELRSYAALAVVEPGSTPTPAVPLPESFAAALDNLPYTQENPLTDGQHILDLVRSLGQRLSGWLRQPGWYLFDPQFQGSDWASSRSTVLRVLDAAGGCESLVYYRKDGRILPAEVTLEDGAWGLIGDVQAGIFTEAETDHLPCSPEQVDNLVLLANEIDYLRELMASEMTGEYRAWVETVDERQVLVLVYDIRYRPPQPVTMDPDTHKLEPEDRSIRYTYFDLETGAILRQYDQVTLQNGKILGELRNEGDPLPLGIHFYENLPSDLLQAFEQATKELRAHLENMTP